MRTIARVLLAIVVVSFSVKGQEDTSAKPRSDLRPQNAVNSVLTLFDKYPVVALGEAHRLQEEHDFIISLIQHPDFAAKVSDIVVEFGNALYQDTLDRYIAGENVSINELRQVWRNTGFSSWTWDAPVYERLFVTVRAVNQKLPPTKRLRVVAGDPPLDWSKSAKEINAVQQQYPRDDHFAAVVEKEVFAKRRKALLIMGMAHLLRHSWNPYSGDDSEKVTEMIELHHPGKVFVIMAHVFLDRHPNLEARLATWPKPSFAVLKNTWLGAIDTDQVMSQSRTRGFSDGKVVTVRINPYPGMKLEDLADGYIYFGDLASLTASYPAAELYRADPDYVRELQRRFELISGGRRFPVESLTPERKSNKYYTPSTPPTRPR